MCPWVPAASQVRLCSPVSPLGAKGNQMELQCSLECKYLNSDDYKDLLWTTLSEFPGEHRFIKRLFS